MKERLYGLVSDWFREDLLTEEEQKALLADCAVVAQKCTGRAKKPVFLFAEKVVKGPWLPEETHRLQRELGHNALIAHWGMPNGGDCVVKPAMFVHPETGLLYLVTPALYPKPGEEVGWEIGERVRSVSSFGPEYLRVVARESVGVVRVSDHIVKHPGYLLKHPEIWEHLIHRCVLQCGDSGLHNMLIRPVDQRAINIDLDEFRQRDEAQDNWVSLLFKAPPARKLMPVLEESLEKYRSMNLELLGHLEKMCKDAKTVEILESHELKRGNWEERLGWLRRAL